MARTTRTAYDWPLKNFWTPATMAAAAERWPPPVSDEMIRIFGTRSLNIPLQRAPSRLDGDAPGLRLARAEPRLLHLALKLLNLNQVLRVKRQARVIAVGLVRAEAAVGSLAAALFHRRREPELLEIPVVVAQVTDRLKVLAG